MNNRSDEDKEAFYEVLQKEIDATLSHYPLIMLGNANAKVGFQYTSWEGNWWVTKDQRISSLYAENCFVTGGLCLEILKMFRA